MLLVSLTVLQFVCLCHAAIGAVTAVFSTAFHNVISFYTSCFSTDFYCLRGRGGGVFLCVWFCLSMSTV